MRDVRRIGVVGAGVMGRGIAYQAAVSGFQTVLYDADSEVADQAVKQIASLVKRQVEKGYLEPERGEEVLPRIETADSLDGFGDCDFVIEAVVEDLDIKQDVFRKLDAVCDDDVVLATNTSAKSITEWPRR